MPRTSSPTPSKKTVTRSIYRGKGTDRREIMRSAIEANADDLSISEGAVLWAIFSFTNDKWKCYPSQSKIAKVTPCNPQVAKRIIRSLKEKGWLITELNNGTSSSTTLIPLGYSGYRGTRSTGVLKKPTDRGTLNTGDRGTESTPKDTEEEPSRRNRKKPVLVKFSKKRFSSEQSLGETRDRGTESTGVSRVPGSARGQAGLLYDEPEESFVNEENLAKNSSWTGCKKHRNLEDGLEKDCVDCKNIRRKNMGFK